MDNRIQVDTAQLQEEDPIKIQNNSQELFLYETTISMISLLHKSNSEEFDWPIICDSLIAMILSPFEDVSNFGKQQLTSLLDQNKISVSELLSVNYIDRSIEVLQRMLPSYQQSSSSTAVPSSIIIMNILSILEQMLTIASERIPISIKLLEVLEQMKNEIKIISIQIKIQMLLSGFEYIWEINKESKTDQDDSIDQLEQQIEESERMRIQIEQETIRIQQQCVNAEQEKKEADERTFIALQMKMDEEKRRIQAEQSVIISEQKIIDIEQKLRLFCDRVKIEGQEMEDLIRGINIQQDSTEMKLSDWIEMKKGLEQEECGTDDQKQLIRQKKQQICQKILSLFVGKSNDEPKKVAIEAGIIEALIKLIMTYSLDQITISQVWALYIFTYSTDEICELLFSKNPYLALLKLLNHPNIFIVNRAISSIYNILLFRIPAGDSISHPHFGSMEACQGIQKLFTLYQRNLNKHTKDFAALTIAQTFKARELPSGQIRHEIITHLIQLLSGEDDFSRKASKQNLQGLSQNAVNLTEIMDAVDLQSITNNLRRPLIGNEEEKRIILLQQEGNCDLLSVILEKRKNDELRKTIINSGIVDALLQIFLNYDLVFVTRPFTTLLFNLSTPSSNETNILIYRKNPYPALIRLLDHLENVIVDDSSAIIFNILLSESNASNLQAPHPHMPFVDSCNGIQKLFDAFNRPDLEKVNKETIVFCIGHLYQGREITNQEMRKQIIAYLKSLVTDGDDWAKNSAKWRLNGLNCCVANRLEIKANGFEIPT
ncbi:MAG: hypothetical protein EZS28_010878 [Streblomastix strix]|uniref:Uncharacterized protein n=1 Tax=Streblomastix strix TaxID=222440 RepID=A0A5J4WG33_9EUKA|nr:MAG: hypothetical protein EZS28_010878 [Streblomastix strix]